MQQRQVLPAGVRTARVIAFVQGGLGVLQGLLVIFGASAVAAASGLSGNGAIAAIVLIGVIVLAISSAAIWGGYLLGHLSRPARLGLLVYECLLVALGVTGLASPGLGVVSLLLAAVAVYYLWFDRQVKEAFAAAAARTPPRS